MKKYIPILLIIAFGIFLRFYLLGNVPAGITSDEADSGYDAYSLLLTGKDQWNTSYPLVAFRGFGDYRSPLYTYLLIPSIKLFDLNAYSVRFPSALAGVLSIILIYLLVRKLFGEKEALASAFLLSISPWGIGLSRQGIESNVAIALFLAGLFSFIKIKENPKFLYLSLVFLIATIYTYTAYIIFTPLSVLFVLYINRKELIKIKKQLIIAVIIFCLSLIPLVFKSSAGSTRVTQVGIGQDITSLGIIEVVNQKIGSCMEVLPSVICRVINNKVFVFSSTFIQNYLHHFSFDFLYIKGTTTQFSLLYERGLFYIYEFVFLLLGLFQIVKNKKKIFIITLLLLSAVPDSLSGGGHHSRASGMLPFLIIIEGVGFALLLHFISNLKNILVKNISYGMIFIIIAFSVLTFAISYFSYFKKYYSPYSGFVYEELSEKLYSQKNNYLNLYMSTYLNDTPQYIYYLFYNKYDPFKFQQKKNVSFLTTDNGFIKITKIDNINFDSFNFAKSLPQKYTTDKGSLFIAHPDAFPKGLKNIHEFKDLTGGVNFEEVEYKSLTDYYQQIAHE